MPKYCITCGKVEIFRRSFYCAGCRRLAKLAAKKRWRDHVTIEDTTPVRVVYLPDWNNLVRCIAPAAEIYQPGYFYAANIVIADIDAGIVPASNFNLHGGQNDVR